MRECESASANKKLGTAEQKRLWRRKGERGGDPTHPTISFVSRRRPQACVTARRLRPTNTCTPESSGDSVGGAIACPPPPTPTLCSPSLCDRGGWMCPWAEGVVPRWARYKVMRGDAGGRGKGARPAAGGASGALAHPCTRMRWLWRRSGAAGGERGVAHLHVRCWCWCRRRVRVPRAAWRRPGRLPGPSAAPVGGVARRAPANRRDGGPCFLRSSG